NNTVNEVWTFGWKIGGILNDHTPGNWTSLASFNLNEILTSTTSSTNVDGTASGNFFTVNLTTFTGLTWNAGETLHIRWADADDLGTDAGLAIDDFTMSVIPEPATWSLLVASLGLYAIWERRRKSRLNQKTSVSSRKDLI
ncbi:MAG: hypothetical protein NZL93_00885, partial [Chthoniobacterales bacterium]|nr:hypothetical protein [Chthoniobacterales bacterium]